MVITLDSPFSVGDLAPGQTFAHAYIVKFGSYGPSVTLAVTFEFGTMYDETMTKPGKWVPCPYNTQTRIELSGQRLAPFYMTMGDPNVDLWHNVEKVLYSQIQAMDPRCAGTIGLSQVSSQQGS